MERSYTCVACGKSFKVMNEAPMKPADIPHVKETVCCPFCQFENEVDWPNGTKFFVVPE